MKNILYILIFIQVACAEKDSNQELKNIEVIEIEKNKELRLTSFVNEIEYFVLPDELFISKIDKVLSFNDFLIICDFHDLSKVFIYNETSKKFVIIDDFGDGPGQYNSILDVTVNSKLNTIDILSLNKIIRYNFDGKFVDEIYKDIIFSKLLFLENDSYIVHIPSNLNDKLINDQLSGRILYNWNSKTNSFYPMLPAYFERKFQMFADYNILSKVNDEVFFSSSFMDTIYSFDASNYIKLKYVLDFGSKKFPLDLIYDNDLASVLNDKNTHRRYYYHRANLHVNSRYLISKYNGDGKFNFIYDKKRKILYSGKKLINDIDYGISNLNVKLITDEFIYDIVSPEIIIDYFKDNENDFYNINNNFTKLGKELSYNSSMVVIKYRLF
ncbi:hypothetical protein [uncultured Cyclobacterium sp.]|uniref:hypothetical protein n=1 Tax=uncultured Cyclobacterium sp. TaxID=453820 RepID=UPI0030EFA186|tara:strand:+ start:192 stop:1343 length:1152 start_codon:yes stop_codon:yes gene_type:complete